MPVAKQGDRVKVQYKALVEGKLLFDSDKNAALEFTLGNKETIPAFEKAVEGMNPGENKTIDVQAKDAFGPYRKELINIISKKELPSHINFEVGQEFQMQQPDGNTILVKVIAIDEKSVTFDANHPLAGKDLTFQISLQDIEKK